MQPKKQQLTKNGTNATQMQVLKLLFAILLFATTHCHAQLEKGYWLVGGSGSLLNEKADFVSAQGNLTQKYSKIELAPNIGFFVANNFAVGINGLLYFQDGSVSTGGRLSGNGYGLGVFSRYYFLNRERQNNFLVQTRYYVSALFKSDILSNNLSVAAGPVIFLNNVIGLEFLLGYVQNVQKTDGTFPEKITQKGVQLQIGVQIHLTK
jgi:hypothetical protein